jgi:phosphotransferase system HPr-like phosphotransfer protein
MEAPQADRDFSFQEKVKIFSHDYLKCCNYLISATPSRYSYTKKLYTKLIASSQLLEDLLDFHGAKNNRQWFYYRELSAAVRHLSSAAYAQKHIFNRFPFYHIENSADFLGEGEKTHTFLVQTLQRLAPAILEEALRLDIPMPEEPFTVADFPRVSTSQILEADIDSQESSPNHQSILTVANEFISIAKAVDNIGVRGRQEGGDLHSLVPARVNEVKIRRIEMVIHNLQSSFDSYVVFGGYHQGDEDLKRLRGHISVVLHLLEISGRLLHFYERHLRDLPFKNEYKKVRDKMAALVDPDQLLDRTVNYGLLEASRFLIKGKGLADQILNQYLERDSITVGVPQDLGFHSRPSLMVAKVVQHYGGKVEMLVGEDRFDASSVLDLQWAGGKLKKEKLEQVVFSGDRRALQDLKILASVNYGEDRMGKGIALPKELDYLR